MNNVLYYINKNENQDDYDMPKSLYSDNYYFVDNHKENEEDINRKDIILYLKNKIVHKYTLSNNNILNNNKLHSNYFLSNYIVHQGACNHFCHKYTIRKINHFIDTAYTNKNILGTIRKLGIELNIIYEKCLGDYETRGNNNKRNIASNKHVHDNKHMDSNKYIYDNKHMDSNKYIYDNKHMDSNKYIYNNKHAHNNYHHKDDDQHNNYVYNFDPVTLIDLLCITFYCLKNYDYINCYYISKYIIKERKGYENDEAILLYITSITNLGSVLKSSQEKVKEIFLLYNERVSYITSKKKKYYYKEENYKYENDYMDYYMFGIIHFLNNNLNKSLLYFIKCMQLKGNFYMCYVYMLYLFLSLLTKERKKNYKKFIFFKCVKLKPHNITPYLIYSSVVLGIYQQCKSENNGSINGYIDENINKNINIDINKNMNIDTNKNMNIDINKNMNIDINKNINIDINKNINIDKNIYINTDDIIYNNPPGKSNITVYVEKIHFLRDILSKALKIENDNIFVCNEYFIYNFLRKEYLQCEIFLKKIIFICKNKFYPNNINVISSILYNMSIYYYIYQKNIYESEKYIILLLENNPFDIKALHVLIHIYFIKKNKNWIPLFDYSIYLEHFLLSLDNGILFYDTPKMINKQRRTTYLFNSFFKQLTKTKHGSSLYFTYYSKLKKVSKFDTFLKKYIRERKEQEYGFEVDWGG